MNTEQTPPDSVTEIPFIPAHPVGGKIALQICCTQLLALLVLRYDLLSTFSTHLIGGFSGDGGLYFWLVRHSYEHFFHLPWFNTLAFYPYSQTLAWSDNFILPSLVFAFFRWLTIAEIPAYNLVLSLAMLANGICMSRLCYRLTGTLSASLAGGALYLGSSYLASVIGHPQLQFAFFFPLAAEFFLYYVAHQKPLTAVALGALVTLAFLTTVYYAIFIVFLCMALGAALLTLRPSAFTFTQTLAFIALILFGMSPLLFFAVPYLEVREVFGAKHLYEPYFFAASARSLISAPYASFLYFWTSPWSHEEAHLFIGLLPLALLFPLLKRVNQAKALKKHGKIVVCCCAALLITSFFPRIRSAEISAAIFSVLSVCSIGYYFFQMGKLERKLGADYLTFRSLSAIFIMVAVIAFCVALGPLGNSAENEWALGIFRVPFSLLPGFNSIRAISRVGILFIFALSVLVALSLKLLDKKFLTHRGWLGLAFAFLAIENFNFPLTKEVALARPLVFDSLNAHSRAGDAMIVLPYAGALKESGEIQSWREFAKINVSAMNWSLGAGIPSVNGYSGQRTKVMNELPRELADFPSKRSVRALKSFCGLKYIVYASQFSAEFNPVLFNAKLREFSSDLKMLQADSDGNYLLELISPQPLDDMSFLLAPSFPPRTLNLELSAQPQLVNSEVKVDIYIAGANGDLPYVSLKLEGGKPPRWYALPLIESLDAIRPVRLSFKIAPSSGVLLHHSRLSVADFDGATTAESR